MDLNERLRSHLEEQYDATIPAGRGAEAAMAAGNRLRMRRNAGWFSVSVVSIAVVGFGLFGVRFAPDGSELAEPEETTVAEGATPTTVGNLPRLESSLAESNIDWSPVDGSMPKLEDAFVSADGFYVLSTVPGRAADPDDVQQAIYSSSDGVDWEKNVVDIDLWLLSIDHHEGALYAVGTAPGFLDDRLGPIDASVARTSDGGTSWDMIDLPLEAAAPTGDSELLGRSVETAVAAGPRGVVALVETRYGVDYRQYAPDEYRDNPDMWAYRTEDGIEIHDQTVVVSLYNKCSDALEALGGVGDPENPMTAVYNDDGEVITTEVPESCTSLHPFDERLAVVFSATWAELGMAEPAPDHFMELFTSTDGMNFDPVALPAGIGALGKLTALDDGFLAIQPSQSYDGFDSAWFSSDGRAWEPVPLPGPLDALGFIGSFEGSWVVLGYRSSIMGAPPMAPAMYVSSDQGSTWEQLELDALVGAPAGSHTWISNAQIGPDQVAMVLTIDPGHDDADTVENSVAYSAVLISGDLRGWSEVTAEDLEVEGDKVWVEAVVTDGESYLLTGWRVIGNSGRRFSMVGQAR